MRTKSNLSRLDSREPHGIVIADGGQSDAAPRFSAFVWGPVPEDLNEPALTKQLVVTAA